MIVPIGKPPALPSLQPHLRSAAGVVIFVVAAAILFAFDPSIETFFPKCPVHAITGLLCPGCGSTRCLHQLLHGRVATALHYNPLTVAFLAFLMVDGACKLVHRFSFEPLKPVQAGPLHPRWIWSVLVAIVLFGILRNIPAAPFSWLAPPA